MTKTKQNKPRAARSLTTTLALAFFILSIAILLANGSVTLYSNITAYQESIAAQQQLVAQDASKTVSKFIQDKFGILETTAQVENLINAGIDTRKQTVLESLLGYDPSFRQLALLTPRGRQLAQVSRASKALSPQFIAHLGGDLLTQTSTGQRYISPVYIDDVTSEPLITIAIPIKNALGDFQGTLAAEVDLKFMWDLVDQLKVGETGYVYVVNDQGTLLAFQDVSRVLRGENVQQVIVVNEFVQNPTAVSDLTPKFRSYTGLLGKDVVGTYVPLDTPQWAVVVELPANEAYLPVIRSSIFPVANIFILAFLAGIAGILVARRLTVPLVNLTEVATRIASGETGLQATVSGSQEVASLATAFNSMTVQLHDLIGSLEQRVASRTQDLATVAEVGVATGAIMETNKLLQQVVELTKERFNLYHSHIYLLDKAGENLVLAAGAGEPGRQMVAEGRSIPLNREQSLVARSARERQGVTVNDVTQAPDFLPNPLLPDTHSELAVPMIVGGNMIGVFDVQSDQIGRFTESDISIQTTLAAQLATSIQNARSFEVTKAQADLETMVNAIGQRIQRTGSVEETLQTAIREIGMALGAQRVRASIERHISDGNESSNN